MKPIKDLTDRDRRFLSYRYTLDKVISTFLRGSRSMDKLTCVIDLQNIGWDSLDGEALKAILTFLQNFYPETLALMVLWKPPTIFWVVYKMVVPFVDKKTRGKIIMAYKQSDLTHAFDVDTLPKTLGKKGKGGQKPLALSLARHQSRGSQTLEARPRPVGSLTRLTGIRSLRFSSFCLALSQWRRRSVGFCDERLSVRWNQGGMRRTRRCSSGSRTCRGTTSTTDGRGG